MLLAFVTWTTHVSHALKQHEAFFSLFSSDVRKPCRFTVSHYGRTLSLKRWRRYLMTCGPGPREGTQRGIWVGVLPYGT